MSKQAKKPAKTSKTVAKKAVKTTAPKKVKPSHAQLAAHYKDVLAGLKKGTAPKTSGELIRARLLENKSDAETIAKEAQKHFKGSTAKASDVYWNRTKLKSEGFKVDGKVGA